MIFKLKTSKQTADIFKDLERRSHLKPFTLVKHAIAWSVKENTPVENFRTDSNGLELNRQTITGNYDVYFKVLIEQVEGRQLSEEEYFPKYMKAHIDRGAPILKAMYDHANSLDKYVLQSLGVGDTV
jgi:DNA sulfur modification protein DndE